MTVLKKPTGLGHKILDQIEHDGASLTRRLPSLSTKTKNTIINALPHVIAIIGFFCFSFGVINLLGKTMRLLFVSWELLDYRSVLLMAVDIISGFLLLSSVSHIIKRKMVGWRYILYATLLTGSYNAVVNPLALIQTVLFFYILFQIKPLYADS